MQQYQQDTEADKLIASKSLKDLSQQVHVQSRLALASGVQFHKALR